MRVLGALPLRTTPKLRGTANPKQVAYRAPSRER
jgi:hypothetical protein